jgi:hypothetical protein
LLGRVPRHAVSRVGVNREAARRRLGVDEQVGAPPEKRRRPSPSTTGAITRRSSSIRPAARSECASLGLPWIWSSRPGCRFSSATCAGPSPLRTSSVPSRPWSGYARPRTLAGRSSSC